MNARPPSPHPSATHSLPPEEIAFHPTSFCDPDGRVFEWQGHLYRGISASYAPFCQNLFDTGIANALISAKFLIETELTQFALPNYPLVLKHRRLPFVSYACEWCPEMLKDAAQFTLDMMRHLAQHGLTVDVGTWDILYDACQPRYVDFCSIAAASTYDRHTWNGVLDDFTSYFLNPLRLMSQGKPHLARWLLSDYEHRTIHAELAALMGQQIYSHRKTYSSNPLARKLNEKLAAQRDPCRLDLVQKMQRSLNQIQILPPKPPSQFTLDRASTLSHLIATLRPATILDLGCGSGQYARLAATSGAQVIAIDRDDRQIARCYQTAKAQQLPVLSLVMDIRYPSAAQGTGKPFLAPATERLACEFVLALDLLHLLIFEQHLTLAQAVDAIAIYATQYLLIEFSHFQPSAEPAAHSPYQLQTLVELLQQQFSQVDILPSKDTHPLLLCQRDPQETLMHNSRL